MNPSLKTLADASSDAYNNRESSDVNNENKFFYFDGQKYTVFDYVADPISGYHATAYKSVASPHTIIIAERGTDTPEHPGTLFQGVMTDLGMIREHTNNQESAAHAFTQKVLDKARNEGIPKEQVSVTGHSLGGALAQIEAARFGLYGATFNAYGAGELDVAKDLAPQKGFDVTNYRLVTDPASMSTSHIGRTVDLYRGEDQQRLRDAGYFNDPSGSTNRWPLEAMSVAAHSLTNYTNTEILDPQKMPQYERRAQENKVAIANYSSDLTHDHQELSKAFAGTKNLPSLVQVALTRLPPDVTLQLNHFIQTHGLDPLVKDAIINSSLVKNAEATLDSAANATRAAGNAAKELGQSAEEATTQAGADIGRAIGAAVGKPIEWGGQAINALSNYGADALQEGKRAVDWGAQKAAQAAQGVIHSPAVQGAVAGVANSVIDTYDAYQRTAQAASDGYNAAKGWFNAAENDVKNAASAVFNKVESRIYNQRDSDGHTWSMNPDHPEQGWTRRATGYDLQQIQERQMRGEHVSETLRASPELSNRLTYLASNAAVELALPKPNLRNPYEQPSVESDGLHPNPWMRDSQTHTWSRTVSDDPGLYAVDGVVPTHQENASPEQAAQLDKAAHATIEQNLANSSQGMAQHYQQAYEQNGWSQYGPMPKAVETALHPPDNEIRASDGHTYTQGPNGQWTTPGTLYGTNQASDSLSQELNATQEQRRQHNERADQSPNAGTAQLEGNHTTPFPNPRNHQGDHAMATPSNPDAKIWNDAAKLNAEVDKMVKEWQKQTGRKPSVNAHSSTDSSPSLNPEVKKDAEERKNKNHPQGPGADRKASPAAVNANSIGQYYYPAKPGAVEGTVDSTGKLTPGNAGIAPTTGGGSDSRKKPGSVNMVAGYRSKSDNGVSWTVGVADNHTFPSNKSKSKDSVAVTVTRTVELGGETHKKNDGISPEDQTRMDLLNKAYVPSKVNNDSWHGVRPEPAQIKKGHAAASHNHHQGASSPSAPASPKITTKHWGDLKGVHIPSLPEHGVTNDQAANNQQPPHKDAGHGAPDTAQANRSSDDGFSYGR